MKFTRLFIALLMLMNLLNTHGQTKSKTYQEVVNILTSYCKDYQKDRYASEPMYFGIEVQNVGSWTVDVTGKKVDNHWEVILSEGLPKRATFVYSIELSTLKGIYTGKINALTAQGKAFAGDYTPMSVRNMDGFNPSFQEDAKINPFS